MSTRFVSRFFIKGLCGAILLTSSLAAYAQGTWNFNLPAQPLADALRAVGGQASTNVFFEPKLVEGRQAPVLSGALTVEQALTRLLAGTGLTYEFVDDETVNIRLEATATPISKVPTAAVEGQSFSLARSDTAPRSEEQGSSYVHSAEVIGVEEVIVTASKRKENVQDIPMSISVFGGETLEAKGARDFEDYALGLPGIAFSSVGPAGYRGGGPTILVRGIGGTGFGATTGYYLNETPIAAQNLKLIDIERVEVLKGPQGTLYGSQAMGGLIRVLTRQARTDRVEGSVELQGSRTEEGRGNYEANGVLNLPIVADKAAMRVAGYTTSAGGYVDKYPATDATGGVDTSRVRRDVNEERVDGARLSFRWTPSDVLAVSLNGLIERQRVADVGLYDTYVRQRFGTFGTITPIAEPIKQELANYSASIEYDAGAFSIVSSTSLYDAHAATTENRTFFANRFVSELTAATPAFVAGAVAAGALPAGTTVVSGPNTTYFLPASNVTYTDQRTIIEEIRVASRDDARLQWLIGGFFEDTEEQTTFYGELPGVVAVTTAMIDVPGLGAVPFVLLGNEILINRTTGSDTREYGLFGELGYAFADQWKASLGVRWYDSRRGSDSRDHSASIFVPNPPPPSADSLREDGVNPRVSLTYRPNDDASVYALAAKGFRRGGFVSTAAFGSRCDADLAALGITPGDEVQVDSDSLWTYELGAKTGWFDGKLIANGSVFVNEWTDIQQALALGCGLTLIQNSGAAESRGAEIEISSMPLPGLQLGLAVGWLDAQITEEEGPGGLEKGLALPLSPKWTYSLSAQYTRPIALFNAGLSAFVRADYQFTDDDKLAFGEDRYNEKPAIGVANLRAGVFRDAWQATLFVENVSNEEGLLADLTLAEIGMPVPFGSDNRRIRVLRPRTVGLSVSYSF